LISVIHVGVKKRAVSHKRVDIHPRLPHNLSTMDKKIKKELKVASGDLPIAERPFDVWAERAGVETGELLEILKEGLIKGGPIRRFGAVLRHTKSGLSVNAMVAWNVPVGAEDKAGEAMSGFSSVSHCYLRETTSSWPYNLYTMIHADSWERLDEIIGDISKKTGVDDFKVLETVRELKKTSPNYFDDED
jgi:DNA-binding Lrp family transcriptional regulator